MLQSDIYYSLSIHTRQNKTMLIYSLTIILIQIYSWLESLFDCRSSLMKIILPPSSSIPPLSLYTRPYISFTDNWCWTLHTIWKYYNIFPIKINHCLPIQLQIYPFHPTSTLQIIQKNSLSFHTNRFTTEMPKKLYWYFHKHHGITHTNEVSYRIHPKKVKVKTR